MKISLIWYYLLVRYIWVEEKFQFDIGNSTTEIITCLIQNVRVLGLQILNWDRNPTPDKICKENHA